MRIPAPIPPPSESEAQELLQSVWFLGFAPLRWALLAEAWPVCERDEHWGQLANTTVPMLMLQGGLDPKAPLWLGAPLRDHFRGPHQTYVEVPYSPHWIVYNSPLQDDPDTTCGGLLLKQFLDDPEAEIDTGCTEDVQPLTFVADDELLLSVFGTTDMWGDEATP